MITYTEGGDTPEKVTHRVLGQVDESYAKKLWEANASTVARRGLGDSGYFAPYRAIWLPEFSHLDNNPVVRDSLLHQLEFIPSHGRSKLAKLEKNPHVNLNHIVGAAKANRLHNSVNRDKGHKIVNSLGVAVGAEIAHRGVERIAKPAEVFTTHMDRLTNL